MKKLEFKKIDAFATKYSDGNPAGCIKLQSENELTSHEMLKIAQQLKDFVSEVGYIYEIDKNTFKLKYFSSEGEVEFCGHATIAIMYDLIINNQELMNKDNIFVITNKGKLKVENKIKKEDAVYIYSPEPIVIKNLPDINDITKSLKINDSYINRMYPISIINAGLGTLILPIKGLENILKINPNIEILKNFCIRNNIDIIEVFSDEVYTKKNNFRVRVFAPKFGYLEDPATGSGNSAFGYYLIKNNIINSKLIIIEQNNKKEFYNIVKLRIKKDDKNEIRVLFGGSAIVRIEGKYIIT